MNDLLHERFPVDALNLYQNSRSSHWIDVSCQTTADVSQVLFTRDAIVDVFPLQRVDLLAQRPMIRWGQMSERVERGFVGVGADVSHWRVEREDVLPRNGRRWRALLLLWPTWIAGSGFGGRSPTAFETRLGCSDFCGCFSLNSSCDVAGVDDGGCVWVHYYRREEDALCRGRYGGRRELRGRKRSEKRIGWGM